MGVTLLDAPAGCEEFFGASWPRVLRYAELLFHRGEEVGVLGPGEGERLWQRHLLNCAAVLDFLPPKGHVVDLGSGSGLPGVVVALMRPDLHVELVEPMERRCRWLGEVVEELGLDEVVVTRARAEELDGAREANGVIARAVAPMTRLAPWAARILGSGGVLAALKGRRAGEEVASAAKAIRRSRLVDIAIHEVRVLEGLEPTWVVTGRKAGP